MNHLPDQLFLRPDFAAALQASASPDDDPFDVLDGIQGEVVRAVARRSVRRIELGGQAYFVKRHHGVGWVEILKNLVIGRLAVVDASNEFRASARLTEAGLSTLTVAAYGRRGASPASRESFVVTDELVDTISLEMLCLSWPEQTPGVLFKRALIEHLASLASVMHSAGVNHRDLYLCHILVSRSALDEQSVDNALTVVDLHRAQIRRSVPQRYLVRDLAGLAFSSADAGLTDRDRLRFLRAYFRRPLRQVLDRHSTLLRRIQRRADALYRKAERKGILSRQLYGDSAR